MLMLWKRTALPVGGTNRTSEMRFSKEGSRRCWARFCRCSFNRWTLRLRSQEPSSGAESTSTWRDPSASSMSGLSRPAKTSIPYSRRRPQRTGRPWTISECWITCFMKMLTASSCLRCLQPCDSVFPSDQTLTVTASEDVSGINLKEQRKFCWRARLRGCAPPSPRPSSTSRIWKPLNTGNCAWHFCTSTSMSSTLPSRFSSGNR
mmetsp:Transcript_1395/g.3041  ORF Transcript_1395/g.3041 Transcript_1395/m.3041 type:complete len:205 (-) Transcript_1395:1365-1979(-)